MFSLFNGVKLTPFAPMCGQYTHNIRGQRGQLPRAQQAKGGVKQLHQNVFEQGTQK